MPGQMSQHACSGQLRSMRIGRTSAADSYGVCGLAGRLQRTATEYAD
jgi:hypothetical protein